MQVNILKVLDHPEFTSAAELYTILRGIFLESLGKRGDYVDWKEETLDQDEVITVGHEDTILFLVLALLHPELPLYIRDIYVDKINQGKRMMDLKSEILAEADDFLLDPSNNDDINHSSMDIRNTGLKSEVFDN